MWNLVIPGTEDSREIVIVSSVFAARTEQYRMTGGSINTLVYGRHSRGKKLDLCMCEVAILRTEIAQRRIR